VTPSRYRHEVIAAGSTVARCQLNEPRAPGKKGGVREPGPVHSDEDIRVDNVPQLNAHVVLVNLHALYAKSRVVPLYVT